MVACAGHARHDLSCLVPGGGSSAPKGSTHRQQSLLIPHTGSQKLHDLVADIVCFGWLQLYVNGEFLGGADIVEEMSEKGELKQALQ